MKRNIDKIKRPGEGKLRAMMKFAGFLLTRPGFSYIMGHIRRRLIKHPPFDHDRWIRSQMDISRLQSVFNRDYSKLTSAPSISILLPLEYEAGTRETLQSILAQLYPHWQLCIVPASEDMARIAADVCGTKDNIVIAPVARGVSFATLYNAAAALATGDYLVAAHAGAIFSPVYIAEVASMLAAGKDAGIIYTDEDKIDGKGKYTTPFFKPGWSPHRLLSGNYIGRVVAINATLYRKLGGMREGYTGHEVYDMLLRATEHTQRIGHIPVVLVHDKSNAESFDALERAEAGQRVIEDALLRRGTPGRVVPVQGASGGYNVIYEVANPSLVSIIIPTKDQAALLRIAIDSIFQHTQYPAFEIVVLNNNSTSAEFEQLAQEYTGRYGDRFRCLDAAFPFNFSRLMNLGAKEAKGEYLLMLNNDVEVIDGNWLSTLVGYAQQRQTGAVGAKLLYADDTIQHAGIVAGIDGGSGHVLAYKPRDYDGYFHIVRTTVNYAAVTAACLLCRRSVFEEVGGMDEDLPVEYNDVDFCFKLLRKGYYNVYLPTVELYHYESATRGHPFRSYQSWQQHDRDIAVFRSKWQPLIANDPFYNPNLSRRYTDMRMREVGE